MSTQLIGISLVICSTMLESLAQLCLKKGALKSISPIQWWVFTGIVLFALEILTWTMALHHIDVSMAYPMASLSLVGVVLLSRFLLGEKVTTKRWIGVGLIIYGTTMVGIY